MSVNRVEVRKSKDGRFRWMLVGEDGTEALGVGAWENAEAAGEAGRLAIGDLARIHSLEAELDGAYEDSTGHEERVKVLEKELAGQKKFYEEQLDAAAQRCQELSESLEKADREHADLKKVTAAESAKVSKYQREVITLERKVEDMEQNLLWYCGGWGLFGGVLGGLLVYWAL